MIQVTSKVSMKPFGLEEQEDGNVLLTYENIPMFLFTEEELDTLSDLIAVYKQEHNEQE